MATAVVLLPRLPLVLPRQNISSLRVAMVVVWEAIWVEVAAAWSCPSVGFPSSLMVPSPSGGDDLCVFGQGGLFWQKVEGGDGGSGGAQRGGGAGQVRGGVRRPHPGARIRNLELVPKVYAVFSTSEKAGVSLLRTQRIWMVAVTCPAFPQKRNQKYSNTCSKIQSVSHRAFALQLMSQLQDKQSLHDLPDVNTPKSSGVTSSDSCSQARSSLSNSTSAAKSSESHRRRLFGSLCRKTPGRTGDTDFDAIGQLKEFPYVSLSSTEESQRIDEVAKQRKELQDKPMMYVEACENHVHAKKKGRFYSVLIHYIMMFQIQVLSNGCSEDLQKVQDALQWEDFFKQKAAPEKNKHFRAIEEAEMVKEAFTREAYSKHNAETVTNMATTEKAKVLDALLSRGKSCRRYSRHEIELATENFSDAKKIGEGGYGIVYRCTLDHTEVAVKVIQQDSRGKIDEFFKERKVRTRNAIRLSGPDAPAI
ncbi:U-box domain-containing protein 34 [Triticum urartu]|uniref:RING-type E3 ubiquitin transferase n=1 Tax=Triticum urartu TaxID=4572 RepID=M7ZMJ5_TRIUA|nr:U-box domain-containing protein 34 [Triticum urartu]